MEKEIIEDRIDILADYMADKYGLYIENPDDYDFDSDNADINEIYDSIIRKRNDLEKLNSAITTKIIHDTDNEEYQVQLFEDGVQNQKATYFTDDKQDAEISALAMIRDYKKPIIKRSLETMAVSKHQTTLYNRHQRIKSNWISFYSSIKIWKPTFNEYLEQKNKIHKRVQADMNRQTGYYVGVISGITEMLYNDLTRPMEWKHYYINRAGNLKFVQKWGKLPKYIRNKGHFWSGHFWPGTTKPWGDGVHGTKMDRIPSDPARTSLNPDYKRSK